MPTRFRRAAIVSVTTDESSRHARWSGWRGVSRVEILQQHRWSNLDLHRIPADLDPLHQLPDDGLALRRSQLRPAFAQVRRLFEHCLPLIHVHEQWLDRVEDRSLVREPVPHPVDHQPLEVPCRDAPAIRRRRLAAGDQPLGDVVAVAPALLVGVGRRQPLAGLVEQQAGQQTWFGGIGADLPVDPVGFQDLLYRGPQLRVDDRRVLARIALVLVDDLAAIDRVLQHQVERTPRQRLAATGSAVTIDPSLADDPIARRLALAADKSAQDGGELGRGEVGHDRVLGLAGDRSSVPYYRAPAADAARGATPPAYGSSRHRFAGRGLQGGGGWTRTLGRANGFVRSEGCGVVVLKRLSHALADRDRVLAVIRGSAINQDGHTNGITAPNGLSQQAVIREALRQAGVDPGQVGYVEAHGTGTPLGDPIEVEALTAVVGQPRPSGSSVALGSLKSNIGHLEGAAGIAGLIKAVLCLQHKQWPPVVHFKTINPHISLSGTAVVIPKALTSWEVSDGRRIAGVSSFGWSGTNAHVVLEEAAGTVADGVAGDGRLRVLPVSARTDKGFVAQVLAWKQWCESDLNTTASTTDVCDSAALRRAHHEYRAAVIGTSVKELGNLLGTIASNTTHPRVMVGQRGERAGIVFVFPGQGSQWLGMGRQLLDTEPVFRAAIEQCGKASVQGGSRPSRRAGSTRPPSPSRARSKRGMHPPTPLHQLVRKPLKQAKNAQVAYASCRGCGCEQSL